jgi:hypothetical protein
VSHDDRPSPVKRLASWWRRAQPRPRNELVALLGSFEGRRVVLVLKVHGEVSTDARRKSGLLDLADLPNGLVTVTGDRDAAREWFLVSAILYVETEDGRRFGPF